MRPRRSLKQLPAFSGLPLQQHGTAARTRAAALRHAGARRRHAQGYGGKDDRVQLPADRREQHGLEEGVSTRLLIYAAQLITLGIPPIDAADVAMCSPITDDRELQRSIREIVTTVI